MSEYAVEVEMKFKPDILMRVILDEMLAKAKEKYCLVHAKINGFAIEVNPKTDTDIVMAQYERFRRDSCSK